MEKDKLKLIVRNLELLIDALKSEVYSDRESCVSKQENFDDPVNNYIMDYDEVFEDDWWKLSNWLKILEVQFLKIICIIVMSLNTCKSNLTNWNYQ